MAAPAFDTGTLSWVRDEIDLALERAGEALARHAAQPAARGPLDEARSFLHQAGGALTIVGLEGVTHVAETIEARLAELTHPPAGCDSVAVDAAAGNALAALRRYLDDLMAGHPDQALRLFPAYRALALAAGLPEPLPQALFFPDLSLRPPRREAQLPLPAARCKALRLGFARGLAKWRAGETRGLTEMRNAVASLEQGLLRPAARSLWWVALAWLDCRPAPGPDDTLFDALDRQFGLCAAEDTEPGEPGSDLLRGLLYGIAVAPAGGEHLECVRAAYRLADLIPDATATVETRREVCRAPLQTAMAEWERFSQGAAIALMHFHDVALLLAASAHDSGDGELQRLTAAIADFAAWLRQQPERADTAITVEVAGTLVLVESAIEQEGTRNPVDEALFAGEVSEALSRLDAVRRTGVGSSAPLAHLRWREHRIIAQVAGEIRVDLAAVEADLDAALQAGTPGELPPGVRKRLHQVSGAFRLLGEDAAAQRAGALESACAAIDRHGDPADLARSLTTLARFAESLCHGRPEHALLDGLAATAPDSDALPAAVPAAPAATTAVGNDAELLAIFLEEAREVLASLAITLPVLADQPADHAALTTVRRSFHTLKGSGRMVGLTDLAEAAYAVEKLLNRRLDQRQPADPALLALLDDARHRLADWVESLQQQAAPPAAADLLSRCAEQLAETGPLAAEGASVAVPPEPTFSAATPAGSPAEAASAPIRVGEATLSPTLYRLYVEEATSHVATLNRELSGPPAIPSRELIRAAHTLAGISAGSGFPAVQALAHALEATLVRHSLAHVLPGEEGRMLLARATGSLEGMVGAIAERRAPAPEAALAAALEALPLPGTAPTGTAPVMSPLAERRQSRPADEVDPQLAVLFLEEAEDQLRQLDEDLRAWRGTPADGDIGRRMARLLHTFKGGARMCGAMGIGELAHSMETRIEQALAAGDASAAVLDGLDTSLGRANHLVEALRQPVVPPAAPVAESQPAKAPAADSGPAVLLRVRADLIDHLVNEAGEMAIARSRVEGSLKGVKGGLLDLGENVARLRNQLREFEIVAETSMQSRLGNSFGDAGSQRRDFDPLELDRFTRLQELTRMMAECVSDVSTVQHGLLRQVDAAGEALTAQSRLNRSLSHALLRSRMVPFSTVAERLHRVVRQTAKELDRQANLDLRGGETPVDRSVLERMLGPLEHLLRNAVAHGIEAPEARRTAGKPELGQVTLTIAPTDNDITLRLEDDGSGLDMAAIRSRAVARGLLAEEDASGDEAIAALIFRPGFSTVDAVSEIAGRGVGLDVVRDEVTRLGGHVEVGSTPGQGTRFEIVLPLTLAVIPVMLVSAGGRQWAIPAAMIEEARELSPAEAVSLRAAGSVSRGGRVFRRFTLPQLFGEPAATAADSPWQLILKGGGEQIALEVDALTQNQEVVVKPLGEMLARVPGLSGATVLPDGTIALIVNPIALAQRALRKGLTGDASKAVLPGPTFGAATVMVVDDSLTVRKITGRQLERAGYRVMTAKDGVDALEKLAHAVPEVILADIEMPRMDGFELVRALRDSARLSGVPVIMITSRIAAKHRQLAESLGVRHYLGKPYDEAELLDLIAALIDASTTAHA